MYKLTLLILHCLLFAVGIFTTDRALAAELKPIEIQMRRNIKLEFLPCPAGSYVMGKEDDNDTNSCTMAHNVTITRPFWLTKFKVTHDQWNVIQKPVKEKGKKRDKKSNEKKIEIVYNQVPVSKVSYLSVMEFCKHLNRKYRSKLPKGYVIRLPTEAEWEYALLANSSDFKDPYVSYLKGSYVEKEEAGKQIIVQSVDFERWVSAFKELPAEDRSWMMTKSLCLAGIKKPNKWGFYDMLGNGGEMMLDTIEQTPRTSEGHWLTDSVQQRQRLKYDADEKDPLRFSTQKFNACVVRGVSSNREDKRFSASAYSKIAYPTFIKWTLSHGISFRLCIGPDLVTEKKAQLKKKK
jgi:formylglycine-generating enzyme required for sulfatase activity